MNCEKALEGDIKIDLEGLMELFENFGIGRPKFGLELQPRVVKPKLSALMISAAYLEVSQIV